MRLNHKSNKKIILAGAFTLLSIVLSGLYTACLSGEPERFSMEGVREYRGQDIPNLQELKPEEYPGEMDGIIQAIDRWYAHKERKQINTAYLLEEFIPRTEDIDTLESFFELGLELFSKLKNAHSTLIAPVYGLPIQAEIIAGKPVITALEKDFLPTEIYDEIEIKPGSIIKKIEGLPAADWLETRNNYFSSSNDAWKIHGAARELFLRYMFEKKTRTYHIKNPGGGLKKIKLTLAMPAPEVRRILKKPSVESRIYAETGYIAVNHLSGNVVDEFDNALTGLIQKESMILDLRKCEGGNSLKADEIFRRFIQVERNVWTGAAGGSRAAKPYKKLNYQGELAILTGPYTFSAAEGLVYDFYDANRAVIIGSPTRGCSGGGPRVFITDGGFLFRFPTRGVDYSASGLEMEGEGLAPHIKIEQTMHEYLQGIDTVLQYALKELKRR